MPESVDQLLNMNDKIKRKLFINFDSEHDQSLYDSKINKTETVPFGLPHPNLS